MLLTHTHTQTHTNTVTQTQVKLRMYKEDVGNRHLKDLKLNRTKDRQQAENRGD